MFGRLRRRREGWSVGADLAPPWYPLPLGAPRAEIEVMVAGALRDGAQRALGRPLSPEEAHERAAEIAELTAVVATQPGVVEAAVLRPEYDGPVQALLTLALSSPGPE